MHPLSPLRTTASSALSGMSIVLSGASKLAKFGARQLAVESDTRRDAADDADDLFAPATRTEPAVAAAPSPDVPAPATQRSAASVDTADVLDDDGHVRTFESHIAELAERPAADVARAVADLSTEELGQLFDYESTHRKRKTVLGAIERAAAPTGEELVYTTETTLPRPR